MTLHRIRRGLDLPIAGEPEQRIHETKRVRRVALLGDEVPGLKPRVTVAVGDEVRRGQVLFEDRSQPGVRYTAPAAGRVADVHRGARRVLQSVVIELGESEADGREPDTQAFASYTGADPASLSADQIRALLVESGQWTCLRARPYSRVPSPESVPDALFVTAADSHPLAPQPEVVLDGQWQDFQTGLRLVARLTEGPTHLCVKQGSAIPGHVDAPVQVEEFAGPHPSGTVGVHIHRIAPVHRERTAWHLGYQDVRAIGHLFQTGRLDADRVVSLAGPAVQQPRLLRTHRGASLDELVSGEMADGEVRVISGSVLSGKKAMGEAFGYLGAYDRQVSVLHEGRQRELLAWAAPGSRTFSVLPMFLSRFVGGPRQFALTTATHGSRRPMMPVGLYEKVLPMDILPTFLLRALEVGDIEEAEKLGALELDEEDLSLCTFVDPGKVDYGPLLRRNLELIEKEG